MKMSSEFSLQTFISVKWLADVQMEKIKKGIIKEAKGSVCFSGTGETMKYDPGSPH